MHVCIVIIRDKWIWDGLANDDAKVTNTEDFVRALSLRYHYQR